MYTCFVAHCYLLLAWKDTLEPSTVTQISVAAARASTTRYYLHSLGSLTLRSSRQCVVESGSVVCRPSSYAPLVVDSVWDCGWLGQRCHQDGQREILINYAETALQYRSIRGRKGHWKGEAPANYANNTFWRLGVIPVLAHNEFGKLLR